MWLCVYYAKVNVFEVVVIFYTHKILHGLNFYIYTFFLNLITCRIRS